MYNFAATLFREQSLFLIARGLGWREDFRVDHMVFRPTEWDQSSPTEDKN